MKYPETRFPSFLPGLVLFAILFALCSCAGTNAAARIPIPDTPGVFDFSHRIELPLKTSWINPLGRDEYQLDFLPTEFSTPGIEGGKVFVGTSAKKFYALSESDGRISWQFDSFGPVESAPAFAEGHVIFGDSDGMLYCLDARSGLLKWSFKATGEIMGQPLVSGDRVFFATTYNRIYAVTLAKGEWIWTYMRDVPASFTVRCVASPVLADGQVYMGFSDGYIVALSPKDGKEIWKNLLKLGEQLTDVDSTPLIDGGSIYVGAYDGALYRLDRTDGSVKWKLEGGGTVSRPVMADGYLFVSSTNGFVYAADKETGKKVWEMNIKAHDKETPIVDGPRQRLKVPNPPLILGDVLVTASSQGFLYALDASTGKIRWRFFPGNGVTSGFATNDDRIYFLGNGGMLFAMRAPHLGGY